MAHLLEPQLRDPKGPKTVTVPPSLGLEMLASVHLFLHLSHFYVRPIRPRPHCVSVSPSFSLSLPFLISWPLSPHF